MFSSVFFGAATALIVKVFPLEIVLFFGTPESLVVFTKVFFTVTLKDFVVLLFKVTVTVVVPVFFPAVSLNEKMQSD